MEVTRLKSAALTITKLPSIHSPGSRELKDCSAGQVIRVLAKLDGRLTEQPPSAVWEVSDNVMVYKSISHNLTSGTAEEADLRAYPLQASFQSKYFGNPTRIPFYISIDSDLEAVGAWFLRSPGTASIHAVPSGLEVSSHVLSDGSTWIGLHDDCLRSGIHTEITCNVSRSSGHIYSVTLARGFLRRLEYDSYTSQFQIAETIFSTRSASSDYMFCGSSFPSQLHEIEAGKHQYTIDQHFDPGFLVGPCSDSASAIYDYSMSLRTYIFYQSASTKDNAPILMSQPLEAGFDATLSRDGNKDSFTITSCMVLGPHELSDTRLPTWHGNIELPQRPSSSSSSSSSSPLPPPRTATTPPPVPPSWFSASSVSVPPSPISPEEEGRRRSQLLRRKDRGQTISGADIQAAGFRTQTEFLRFDREMRGRERAPRTRANV